MSTVVELLISDLTADPELQPRQEMSQRKVVEYADAMNDGAVFDPLVAFHDPAGVYWLADGWHRRAAFQRIGILHARVRVHQGSRRDALHYAVSANATHGVAFTNADKRRAVTLLLQARGGRDGVPSNREIARMARVSHQLVNNITDELWPRPVPTSSPAAEPEALVEPAPAAEPEALVEPAPAAEPEALVEPAPAAEPEALVEPAPATVATTPPPSSLASDYVAGRRLYRNVIHSLNGLQADQVDRILVAGKLEDVDDLMCAASRMGPQRLKDVADAIQARKELTDRASEPPPAPAVVPAIETPARQVSLTLVILRWQLGGLPRGCRIDAPGGPWCPAELLEPDGLTFASAELLEALYRVVPALVDQRPQAASTVPGEDGIVRLPAVCEPGQIENGIIAVQRRARTHLADFATLARLVVARLHELRTVAKALGLTIEQLQPEAVWFGVDADPEHPHRHATQAGTVTLIELKTITQYSVGQWGVPDRCELLIRRGTPQSYSTLHDGTGQLVLRLPRQARAPTMRTR